MKYAKWMLDGTLTLLPILAAAQLGKATRLWRRCRLNLRRVTKSSLPANASCRRQIPVGGH